MKLIDYIIIIAVVLFVCVNVYKMVQRAKKGQSIEGCDGDCSHCGATCNLKKTFEEKPWQKK